MEYRRTNYVGDCSTEEVFEGEAAEIVTLIEGLGELKETCEHRGSVKTSCANITADKETAFIVVKCVQCETVFWQGNVSLIVGDD